MIKLDDAFLNDLGLGQLSKEAKDSLLKTLYDRLELNVGTVIASQLSDAQLDEFEALIDGGQQQQAREWLQTNYPNYKQVVEQELEKLKEEIRRNAPAILAADQKPAEAA